MTKFVFTFAFLFMAGIFWGKEQTASTIQKKKYTLSVCALVRNEAKYLKEWIEFHRLVGVDHFYLYNNNSSDRLHRALSAYLRKGLVTLIPWPDRIGPIDEENQRYWALAALIPAYENAIVWTPGKETKWLALLTTDEFLVPPESISLKALLAKYETFPAIHLSCDVFDASKWSLSFPTKLMIESLDLAKAKPNPYTAIPPIIVRPEEYAGFEWPPYRIRFKNDREPIDLKRSSIRINRYINRDKSALETMKHKLDVDPRSLAPGEVSHLLENGYVLEDQERAIFRFLPTLKSQFNP